MVALLSNIIRSHISLRVFLKPHLARASGYISLVDHLNSPTLKGLSTIKAALGLHKGLKGSKIKEICIIYESDYTGAKFYYQMPFISSSELCSRI